MHYISFNQELLEILAYQPSSTSEAKLICSYVKNIEEAERELFSHLRKMYPFADAEEKRNKIIKAYNKIYIDNL